MAASEYYKRDPVNASSQDDIRNRAEGYISEITATQWKAVCHNSNEDNTV